MYARSAGLVPFNYKVHWGYEDDKLFKFAKEESIRLAKIGKPFHLVIKTSDLHEPRGYLPHYVKRNYTVREQYKDVIRHSSKLVYEFVEFLKSQDFYDDTVLVITGDHLTRDKIFTSRDNWEFKRSTFNLILNSSIVNGKFKNRGYAPFDIYPTILASMGVEIKGDKLGLGTNLFSDEKTLLERYGEDYLNNELGKNSNFYDRSICF